MTATPFFRGRRLRQSAPLRALVREHRLYPEALIMPYFVVDTDDEDLRKPIASMPGQYQLSLKQLELAVASAVSYGLHSVLLFGIPKTKDPLGTEGYAENGIVQRAVRLLKNRFPDLIVVTDVCLCEYTSHGHCGVLEQGNTCRVLNDATLPLLNAIALSHARAGADIVAPSDMMDGRIQSMRKALDAEGFVELPIMSYAVKYASAYYGPFRDAAESAPASGDRKSYQMDPANAREGLQEACADTCEGADILIVKPAGPYLDVLARVAASTNLPMAAYQVSGEYSLIKAASLQGWVNEDAIVLESLIGIKRAGADIIISYFTVDVLQKGLLNP